MISATHKNNPTFTSVIPVKVHIDGMEVLNNPKIVRSAIRQLTTTLAGPAKGNAQKVEIIREFAKHDPDYRLEYGYNGYPKIVNHKKMLPSDYFRCICDSEKSFIFTGEQANKLKELGKDLGEERVACKSRNIVNSFDLQVAKRNYARCIMNFLRSTKLRICEGFEGIAREKTGKPVILNLHMNSNGKYGQSNFKMAIADVTYTK